MTVSGFSAGGTFAHLMQIVHSSTIKGAAILNGAPYTVEPEQITDKEIVAEDLRDQAGLRIYLNTASEMIDHGVNLVDIAAYIVGGTDDDVIPLKN